jgi:hypothetical protein
MNYLYIVVHDTRISFREEPKTEPLCNVLSTKHEHNYKPTVGKAVRVGMITGNGWNE